MIKRYKKILSPILIKIFGHFYICTMVGCNKIDTGLLSPEALRQWVKT